MVREIVNTWIERITEEYDVKELHQLPREVIDAEIDEAKGTIDNCTIADDDLGICCNKRYIEYLNEAIKIQEENQ